MAEWRYADGRGYSERYSDRGRTGSGIGSGPGSGPGSLGLVSVDESPAKRRRDYDFINDRDGPLPSVYGSYGRDRPGNFDDRLPPSAGAGGSWREVDLRGPPVVSGPFAPVVGATILDDVVLRSRGMPPPDMPPLRGGPLPPFPGAGAELAPPGGVEPPLPTDATATLYIDNLPDDCSRREASHIFRPFIGFKEVRLVHKEVRRGSTTERVTMCFVDFADAHCAATALEALQGYRFDESDYASPNLRIDFARQGPRHGVRGREEVRGRDYDGDRGYGRRR